MQPTFQEEEDEPLPSGERGRNLESYKSNHFFFFYPGSLLGSEVEDGRKDSELNRYSRRL